LESLGIREAAYFFAAMRKKIDVEDLNVMPQRATGFRTSEILCWRSGRVRFILIHPSQAT